MFKRPFKKTLSLLFLGLCITSFQNCLFESKDERVAGGAEDFPNTVALGSAVSGHLSNHTEWDQFSVIPSTLPSFVDVDSLVIAPDSKALAKSSAIGLDSVVWDYSDTATLRLVRRIHLQENFLKIRRDTSVYLYDEKTKDSISLKGLLLEYRGIDSAKGPNRFQAFQTYRYENLDSIAGFERASFYERRPVLGGGFRHKFFVMLPGPDGDISTKADNRPAFYSYLRTVPGTDLAQDTAEAFQFKDADGDGTLWGQGDSGFVDFQQKTTNPIFRPTVASVTQKIRAILFKDELKTYPIAFTETRIEKDGKKIFFSVKGTREDSIYRPGDTALISVHTTDPAESNRIEKHSRYRVRLGSQPKSYQDNALIQYSLAARWRNGPILSSHIVFSPDQPVASNELSITGGLELGASFVDGDSATGKGRFENKLIEVNLTVLKKTGAAEKFHTRWDSLGKLLFQNRIK